ncbi:hypothetical protein DPMN_007758 [Dreissena polymorpha]|uniref:Hexosyltransferase n=2 Tax=Dreissena polymorpha TaxID=45954 RepID=A0A9D4MUW3_DREPO|nr:hypothetical protein DPMN_007758 [Dreissena polymorpha]
MVVFFCVIDHTVVSIGIKSTKYTIDDKHVGITHQYDAEFEELTRKEQPKVKWNNFYLNYSGKVDRLQLQAIEARYFSLPETKVNPIDHELIITGKPICDLNSPYLLIVVPSVPSHVSIRAVIRNTIGSYGRYTSPFSVKLVFVLGRDGDAYTDLAVRNESHFYGDIVQADFVESYYNLTRKMLVTLKWVSVYCSEIDYMLKLDEDVFVNIPVLIKYLKTFRYTTDGSIHGHINSDSPVRRTGKWAVKWTDFPMPQYPNYAAGNSYVISGNIISRMFTVSEYLPYIPIEDVFVTGILGKIVKAELVQHNGFTYWLDSEPFPCAFAVSGKISSTKVSSFLMRELWNACTAFHTFC